MGLDATGHYVPASTDAPARSAFDKLSRSLRDPFPVADTAARTALLVALAAASPAVTPSTSSPIFFHQADLPAGHRTVYTVDGSNFISLSGAFVWADAAARTAATTMAAGDKGFQVDTKVLYRYDGTTWKGWDSDWISYTPTLTNLTLGNGTLTCRWKYSGGNIMVRFGFLLGSTSAISGVPVFTLPIEAYPLLAAREVYNGSGTLFDVSTNYRYFGATATDGSSTTAAAVSYLGTSGRLENITASLPFAWAAGDTVTADFIYRPV